MDPNEALAACRAAVTKWDDGGAVARAAQAEELRDYFDSLDEWLSKGGFLPADWDRSPE